MHFRYRMLFLFFSVLTAGFLVHSCDKSVDGSPFNNNDWVLMGSQEGMIYQEFVPPLSASGYPESEIMIYPDTMGEEYIHFYVYESGPTGCRNFKQEVVIEGSDSVSFLYHYEEHTEYYAVQWKKYVYNWEGVEIDSVREHMNSFQESESPVGPRGMNVLSAFLFADTVFSAGNFSEGGSLSYADDPRLDYSTSTSPGSACRINPDSSYVRNDTTIVFFTQRFHHFEYNQELYNPDGVYIVFKLIEKGRERLGWLKLTTNGSNLASVSCCATQK